MFEPDVPVTVDERHFALEPDDVVPIGPTTALDGEEPAHQSKQRADHHPGAKRGKYFENDGHWASDSVVGLNVNSYCQQC